MSVGKLLDRINIAAQRNRRDSRCLRDRYCDRRGKFGGLHHDRVGSTMGHGAVIALAAVARGLRRGGCRVKLARRLELRLRLGARGGRVATKVAA